MRITNGMLTNNMLSNLNSNLNRMERYQNQGATGRKFDKPSDDPIGMSRSLKLYTDISKVKQYERNLNDANSWMHTTEEALGEIEKILQRTRELAAGAANGTNSETDTKAIAEEIKQLKEQVIQLGNARHAGRSIFTGFKTDKDLLKRDGSYNIDISKKDVSKYNVGISEDIDVNIVGSRVFGPISDKDLINYKLKENRDKDNKITDNTVTAELKKNNLNAIKTKLTEEGVVIADIGIDITTIDSYSKLPTDPEKIKAIKAKLKMTGGTDNPDELWLNIINKDGDMSSKENERSSMIDVFDNIIAAMNKGDHEQINQKLTDIDKVHQNIISIKAEVGAKTNRLDMTEKRLSSEKLNFETNLSQNEDVDYAELIMKTKIAETVYQASLSISGRIIQPTLMDFLR